MGEIKGICISDRRGIQKQEIPEVNLIEGWGLEGDAHGGKWHRQVSLLSYDKITEFRKRGADVDFGSFGENITIRIFDLSSGIKNLVELGFAKKDFLWLKNIISHPYGIFLIVGPTGSGKTTTLYSLVNEIKSPYINIITLEDPIEYQIEGIRQLELREDGLMSFADGIKAILRHDPDVTLVGAK